MVVLVLGLVLFLGVHSISIFAPNWRAKMVSKSELGWKAVYGLLSLIGLWLIVRGYAAARFSPQVLYIPPFWLRHIVFLLMLPVFILALAPYFPGAIKAKVRHPLLLATIIWASAHLLVNGMVADVLLFGGFLLWAIVDWLSFLWRSVRPLPIMLKPSGRNDLIAIVLGVGLYVAFLLYLHTHLIGIALV